MGQNINIIERVYLPTGIRDRIDITLLIIFSVLVMSSILILSITSTNRLFKDSVSVCIGETGRKSLFRYAGLSTGSMMRLALNDIFWTKGKAI